MSADLLRRAALKLREHAQGAVMNGYMPAPWRTVLTDSESMTGFAGCAQLAPDEHAPNSACDDCTSIEAWTEPAAAYLALMHPPVALAVADLLDGYAEKFDLPPFHGFKNRTDEQFIALARAVLREEAS